MVVEADNDDTVDEILGFIRESDSGLDDVHTTILTAAATGHADIVDILVRKIGNPNIPDKVHGSVLGRAIARRQADVAKVLLGIEGIELDTRDAIGRTALFLSII